MSFKRHIPNLITLLNLVCGVIGIACLLESKFLFAIYLVIAAGIFDVFDGLVARLLKVQSALGAQLDSLADLVSFGVLPALLYYAYLQTLTAALVTGVVLLLPCFSAWRLARFNLDEEQRSYFNGLPSPAAALALISIPLLSITTTGVSWLKNPSTVIIVLLVGFPLLVGLLMVSDVKLLNIKFHGYSWKANRHRYILIGLFFAGLILFGQLAFLPLLGFYIIYSIGIFAFK